jgi:hypothetical protein
MFCRSSFSRDKLMNAAPIRISFRLKATSELFFDKQLLQLEPIL